MAASICLQTVARTLKHTVEAATLMIVATLTNDQENCNNNSINRDVTLLLPLCSCHHLLATVVWSHHFVAAIIISVVNVASCVPSPSLFHPPLLRILHPLSPLYLPWTVQHTALQMLLQKLTPYKACGYYQLFIFGCLNIWLDRLIFFGICVCKFKQQ